MCRSSLLPLLLIPSATACQTTPGACRSHGFTEQQCHQDDTDGVDTGPFLEMSPEISLIQVSVDGAAWAFSVELQGWSGLVTVDMREVQGEETWAETHPLDNVDYARDGTWDKWYKRIFVVSDWADQVDGVSTRFPANEGQVGRITWMVSAWDRALESVKDCVTWGADPSLYNGFGCREWTWE